MRFIIIQSRYYQVKVLPNVRALALPLNYKISDNKKKKIVIFCN